MDEKKNPMVENAPETQAAMAAAAAATDGGPLEPLIRAVGHPRVTLERSARPPTEDEILWMVIRNSTNQLSFANYSRFLDNVLCGDEHPRVRGASDRKGYENELHALSNIALPFPGVDPYRLLKVATEVFLMLHCGVRKICTPTGFHDANGAE